MVQELSAPAPAPGAGAESLPVNAAQLAEHCTLQWLIAVWILPLTLRKNSRVF